jgi:O-antigen biosynthesis protein
MAFAAGLTLLLTCASFAPQNSAETYFAMGIRYTREGDHARARNAFLKALELQPNSIPVLNNLGVNALNRGDEGAAARYFRRTLALAPNDANALFNLGLIELKHRKFPDAARHLKQAVAQHPRDMAMLQGLLAAQLEVGERAGVDETARRLLDLAPAEPGFFVQLAEPIAGKGFHQTALLVLERARQSWPDSAELQHMLGDVYEGLDLYDKAVEAYQSAVRLAPEKEEYWFALGYEFLSHRNFDLAEKIFTGAISRLPRRLKLHLGLSAVYIARDQYEEAIAALRAAIDADPESDAGYFFLGQAFVFLSGHEDLFAGDWLGEKFNKYMQLKPGDPYPYYLCAASLLRRAGGENPDRKQAAALLKKALDLDPKFPEAHFELGKIYFDDGDYQQAIGAYERAVSLRPTFAEAYYRLSRAYAVIGNQNKAREAAEQSAKLRKAMETSVLQREKEILRFVYTLK